MEAVTLVMPRHQARQAFLDYRRTITLARAAENARRTTEDARRVTEDTALTNAYREIARGNPVVDLPATMKHAGLGADFYPRLAIMRADQTHCHVMMRSTGDATYTRGTGLYDGRPPQSTRFALPSQTFGTWTTRYENGAFVTYGRPSGWEPEATALVPTIPAALRPKASLERFCILWEAVWTRAVPRDPMLLRPLGWPFFAVVAVWDLTELEHAVLRGRLS